MQHQTILLASGCCFMGECRVKPPKEGCILTYPFWYLLGNHLDLFQEIGWDTVDPRMERRYEWPATQDKDLKLHPQILNGFKLDTSFKDESLLPASKSSALCLDDQH